MKIIYTYSLKIIFNFILFLENNGQIVLKITFKNSFLFYEQKTVLNPICKLLILQIF